jgi:hypothetical protein
MKFKNFLSLMFVGLMATTVLTVQSCKDDDDAKPAPTVTLSSSSFTGKIGETATVTATVVAPAGLKSLTITKYLGTTVDATYGTNGSKTVAHESHTETYTLGEEGLDTPVRFKFEATDEKDQTASADFIVTTEASTAYLLTNFNWQWKSKRGKCLDSEPETEQILECEKDNVYSFNADGTYTLDYGAITGMGGGTCDFDGFRVPTTWELNTEGTQLTIRAVNAFDPNDVQTEVYNITEANNMAIKSTQTIDLSVFGCGAPYDWKFEWTAKPK